MKLITLLTFTSLAVAAPTVTELVYYCTGLDGKGDCGAVYTTGCSMLLSLSYLTSSTFC
jgi:hypothetical protein